MQSFKSRKWFLACRPKLIKTLNQASNTCLPWKVKHWSKEPRVHHTIFNFIPTFEYNPQQLNRNVTLSRICCLIQEKKVFCFTRCTVFSCPPEVRGGVIIIIFISKIKKVMDCWTTAYIYFKRMRGA